jgi:uncharacterized protein (TIGR03437 family)
MLNRNVPLVVCLSMSLGAAFGQTNNQGNGYVFEFANTATASGQFQGFLYNATSISNPVVNGTGNSAGPVGASQVIAKPDGSKFYILGGGGLETLDATFSNPKTINGLTGTLTQAVITQDGRYLLVASNQGTGASTVYLLNTSNDTVSFTQAVTGAVIGMVVSNDSKTAWILGESSQTFIIVLNLSNQSESGRAPIVLIDPVSDQPLGGNATSFSLSPLGLLYVTAGNSILEIDPAGLQTCLASISGCTPVLNNISVNATPGPLQFTPDGTAAYFVNTTPTSGGKSLLRMSLPTHNFIFWPPAAGQQTELFDSIIVASPTRIFAHSPADTTLWDIAPDFSTVAVTALSTVVPATTVLSIVTSNELPAAQYLFALVGGGTQASIYRVNLSTNGVDSQASSPIGQGTLQFAYVPEEANPSLFLQYNTNQTVAAGATAAPLTARVLDAIGRPVFAIPVTFTGDPSLTFTNVSTTTNASGFVQATVTVGQTPGNYPVTLTAGTAGNIATAIFNVTIPGGTTGPTGGPSQISIVSGNGQLYQNAQPRSGTPLVVQVVDTSGNPLQNADVTFTVTGPNIAALDNPNATTDQNGLASTDFSPGFPPQNTPFQATNVTATATSGSTTLGSVTFVETIYQINPDGLTGKPSFNVLQPSNLIFNAGEGDPIPDAIIVLVSANSYGTSQPIPNVGIRIADPANPENNGAGSCQGNPLSDNTGTIHCTFIASCSAGLGLHGIDIVTGEANDNIGYAITITSGSTFKLAAPTTNTGNGQSGRPGSTLSVPLVATVTDQCGTPAQNVPVTWTVTQGSATLSVASGVTNQGGNASTRVTLGQTPGPVTIVAAVNSTTGVTFTETVQAVVGSLTLVSGNGQSALLNTAFLKPLIFQVNDTSNNPVPGLTVNFSVAGGSASLSTASATTNTAGQASVSVTAGNTPGSITISATYNTLTAVGTLTAMAQGPGVNPTGFVNAASQQPGLVPCGLASVTGTGLVSAPGVVLGNTLGIGPLPYTISGVSISVNGVPAPLQSVSNQSGVQQVNFQTPCETVAGNATVVVTVNGASSTIAGVTVYPAQPGIFTYAGPNGTFFGWVISATDGSYLSPSNLAHAGQTYFLVATGLGQTAPTITTDAEGTGTQIIPTANVVLAINNNPVTVLTAQYVQNAIGEYIVEFTIPVTLNNGSPFPTGTNLPITLGITASGQTIYDTSPVALPGIH